MFSFIIVNVNERSRTDHATRSAERSVQILHTAPAPYSRECSSLRTNFCDCFLHSFRNSFRGGGRGEHKYSPLPNISQFREPARTRLYDLDGQTCHIHNSSGWRWGHAWINQTQRWHSGQQSGSAAIRGMNLQFCFNNKHNNGNDQTNILWTNNVWQLLVKNVLFSYSSQVRKLGWPDQLDVRHARLKSAFWNAMSYFDTCTVSRSASVERLIITGSRRHSLITRFYHSPFEWTPNPLAHLCHKEKLFRKLLIKYEVIISNDVEKMICRGM